MKLARSLACFLIAIRCVLWGVGAIPQWVFPVGYEWLYLAIALGWLIAGIAGDK